MKAINDPNAIELKSFEIIKRRLSALRLPKSRKDIIQRVIHATADLKYAQEMIFHPNSVKAGLRAIKAGKDVITDVNMVRAGINGKILGGFGGKALCFLRQKGVAQSAERSGITKTAMAMRKAVNRMDKAVVAIGNAPTALFEVCDLIEKGKVGPALIVGVPVGFVRAAESKKKLRSLKVPYITNRGRKGGSSVAAAIINALLLLAKKNS